MAYEKTQWVNGQAPPINAENLNHIENGIEEAHDDIGDMQTDISNLQTSLAYKVSKNEFKDMFYIQDLSFTPGKIPYSDSNGTHGYRGDIRTISKEGYSALAISGFRIAGSNSAFIFPYRFELENRTYTAAQGAGTAELYWGIRTIDTSKEWNGTVHVEILWIKRAF